MIISLTQFNIKRPERVTYDFPISDSVHLLNNIKSKSLRSFLSDYNEVLVKNNIKLTFEDVEEEKFVEWLPYYKERMEEQGHDVLAKIEWYREQVHKGIQIKGIFLYQNNKLVGSGIFGLHGVIANFAYKASDRITISAKASSSLGSIIEFLFLKLASESGCKMANSRSRNAFGFYNKLGYLDYKLRFGYIPRPSDGVPLLDDVPVGENGCVLFYGLQDGKLTLFSLQPEVQKGKDWFDKSRFSSPEIPLQEIYY